jgi:hypothetical protein
MRFAVAASTLATMSVGIAAVWLTGDPRSFGVVVALVGLIAGIVVWRYEWVSPHSPRDTDAATTHGAARVNVKKAA